MIIARQVAACGGDYVLTSQLPVSTSDSYDAEKNNKETTPPNPPQTPDLIPPQIGGFVSELWEFLSRFLHNAFKTFLP